MTKPDKAGASAPHHAQQAAPAATVAPPPHPADSAVSYVVQTAEAAPASIAAPAFWDKWGPPGLAFLGVIITLFGKWILAMLPGPLRMRVGRRVHQARQTKGAAYWPPLSGNIRWRGP